MRQPQSTPSAGERRHRRERRERQSVSGGQVGPFRLRDWIERQRERERWPQWFLLQVRRETTRKKKGEERVRDSLSQLLPSTGEERDRGEERVRQPQWFFLQVKRDTERGERESGDAQSVPSF